MQRFKVLWVWLLCLGLGGGTVSLAQDLCQSRSGGGFTINGAGSTDPVIGCAPFAVTVVNTVAGANNIAYTYDYKGEASPITVANTTFSYAKPGKYRILQVGSSGATGFAACREIIVLDKTPPKVTVTPCAGKVVRITLADDSTSRQYDQIEVQWNDGSPVTYINKGQPLTVEHTYPFFSTALIFVRGVYTSGTCSGSAQVRLTAPLDPTALNTVNITNVEARTDGSVSLAFTGIQNPSIVSEVWVKAGTGVYTPSGIKSSAGGQVQVAIPSLDPKQVYCFKIRTSDACGNFRESNALCSQAVTGTAENERNVIQWNQTTETLGFISYQLLKNGTVVKNTTSFNDVSYVDNNVQCGITYRYEVIATTDKARSLSAPIEITAKSNVKPGIITQSIISVEQNGSVSLIAFPPTQGTTPTYKMIFERSPNGAPTFQEIGTIENTNRYSDLTAATSERSYCYHVTYENACGNRSEPSEPICTIFLQKAGNTIRWSDDVPFSDAMGGYFVIKLNQGGASSETGVGLNTTYDPQYDDPNEQEFNYQIRARSSNGAFLSYSNVILFRREAALFLPDAFSPNGDGINDTFGAKGIFFDNFQLIIYNRWGQPIFQSTSAANGWDGTLGGNHVPEGNYIYKVTITDNTGKQFVKAGTVLLLR